RIADLGLGQGSCNRALDVLAPDLARAVTCLQPHEVRGLFARIVSVGVAAVLDELAGDSFAGLGACRGVASLIRFPDRRRRYRTIGRDHIALGGSLQDRSSERTDQLRLLLIGRLIAADRQALQSRLTPGFLPKALGARDRNLRPAARMGDLDEASHDLSVL